MKRSKLEIGDRIIFKAATRAGKPPNRGNISDIHFERKASQKGSLRDADPMRA
ncbi:hypothetical protein [Brucella intermedia]|uniref:hypothetical protein n=1 Tax=Brucella intermedia TaxID=94625 RepID=UPI002360F884|nr:hypothetical protein [Brucella intermedia]